VEKYVPCDGVYTSLVVAVSELPGDLSAASTNEELSEHMYEVCAKPGREALGGSVILRRTSLFRPLFFLPSTEQRKQGARWFACDISANDEEGMIPLPAPTPFLVKPAGDTKPIKRYAQCVRLNDDDTSTLVGCDKKHILAPGFVLTCTNEKAAKGVDQLKECKRGKAPEDAAYILGGLGVMTSQVVQSGDGCSFPDC